MTCFAELVAVKKFACIIDIQERRWKNDSQDKEVPSRDSIIKNILTSTDAGLDYLAMIVCKVLGFSYKEVK